jgi:S-adenosylmethionine:tRNA ribosyltransferase-isomerase
MTDEILESLRAKGVNICYLTLHVGLGTFMPIRVDDIEKHKMHQEYFEIPAETIDIIKQTKSSGHKVFALGTTVTRTLEYAADDILPELVKTSNQEKSSEQIGGKLKGEADIFIYPGYEFKLIDGLITNFHAPKSTVLMLASAFAGWDNLLAGYNHAAKEEYKFLSYGDSVIIHN